jgi:hypothetical protein
MLELGMNGIRYGEANCSELRDNRRHGVSRRSQRAHSCPLAPSMKPDLRCFLSFSISSIDEAEIVG